MEHNPVFDTAVDFVNNTACPIFLTGKAGTGKTTFLKYIKEHTPKRCVVVAPTGVAAINAGGVTMHSFFQLPFGPYVPVVNRTSSADVTDKHTLFKNIRFSADKRDLLRDLELLIIDEVSMVRADTLDAMDAILRYFRRKPHKVFGGVQVLFIGDLFQLPPVMPDNEWAILREHYASPFFFHSKAILQSPPVYLELKKIYRQNEQQFIEILNRIRNNEVNEHDLEILNGRYRAELIEEKKYITLTSHNYKADRINQEALKNLPGELFEFKGTVEGDFPEKALPTEVNLQLKEGAQVMFIRNDKSEERRFFNGKIATVSKITDKGISVIMNEAGEELVLEKETWDNIRYSYNTVDEKIDEEKLGSFSQYPIRLAWAITIHKSQGLTFEHAIIDAGESFAPGQVYVALSRCVSLEGMVLHSRIDAKCISTHEEVLAFGKKETKEDELAKLLEEEKHVFVNTLLLETFDFYNLIETLEGHLKYTQGKKIPDVEGATKLARNIIGKAEEQQKVALKFRTQLETLLKENDHEQLKIRVNKAIEYFRKAFYEEILQPIDNHIASLKGVKKIRKYLKAIKTLKLEVAKKIHNIENARLGDLSLNASDERISIEAEKGEVKIKPVKGESLKETLVLLKGGTTVPEIAKQRGLAVSTIEGHVANLVKSGDIKIESVVSENKLNKIIEAIRETEVSSLNPVKAKLGDNYSFGEIRAVFNHLEFVSSQS